MRALLASAGLGAACTWSHAAAADCVAQRPTQESAAWTYAGAPAGSLNSPRGSAKVWYATSGAHAPKAGTSDVPPLVTLTAEVADTALTRFAQLGFLPPVSDANDASCDDDGDDERIDLYLFDFPSADGTAQLSACSDGQGCSGFVLFENDFIGKGYSSPAVGVRTVVPHELFHLIQYAYATEHDVWWSEGTAQWAAKAVNPELTDLERFLPAFFSNTHRPLDFPPSGAAAAFSYGAAIWPVFLSERFGRDIVREVFEQLAAGAASTLDATEAALLTRGSSLSHAFAEFASWNAATSLRHGEGGYAHGGDYPSVKIEALTGPTVPLTLAGLSARYFSFDRTEEGRVTLSAGATRAVGTYIPLVDGRAVLSEAKALPVTAAGPGVIAVVGQAWDHRDVAVTLSVEAAVDPAESLEPAGASNCCFRLGTAPNGALAVGLLLLAERVVRRRSKR